MTLAGAALASPAALSSAGPRPSGQSGRTPAAAAGRAAAFRRQDGPGLGPARRFVACSGLNIDRRAHLEHAWKRQQQEEQAAAERERACPVDCVDEIRDLQHLEKILAEAGAANQLVVVDFYNRACGACRAVLPFYQRICKQGGCAAASGDDADAACSVEDDGRYLSAQQRVDAQAAGREAGAADAAGLAAGGGRGPVGAGGRPTVRFFKHDVMSEYDEPSAVSELYRIKAVPAFGFFIHEAKVESFASRSPERLEEAVIRLLARMEGAGADEGGPLAP